MGFLLRGNDHKPSASGRVQAPAGGEGVVKTTSPAVGGGLRGLDLQQARRKRQEIMFLSRQVTRLNRYAQAIVVQLGATPGSIAGSCVFRTISRRLPSTESADSNAEGLGGPFYLQFNLRCRLTQAFKSKGNFVFNSAVKKLCICVLEHQADF